MDEMTTLIYTEDMENISFVQECKNKGTNCISVVDARSAVYIATGISAQNQSKVAVCMNVVVGHYTALNCDDVLEQLNGEFPMHIELLMEIQKYEKSECDDLQILLSSILDKDTYLYISPSIKKSEVNYMGKVVYGGMPDCYEGSMANVLGASLAGKRKKYVGLISEDEFIHDINTLGNININDLVCYIVISQEKNKMILDYAKAMKFETFEVKSDYLKSDDVNKMVLSKNKGVLMVYKEG